MADHAAYGTVNGLGAGTRASTGVCDGTDGGIATFGLMAETFAP